MALSPKICDNFYKLIIPNDAEILISNELIVLCLMYWIHNKQNYLNSNSKPWKQVTHAKMAFTHAYKPYKVFSEVKKQRKNII